MHGSNLKKLRKRLSLSQDAFGKKLGVTGAGISKIESGDRKLTEQMIISICREYGAREEFLRTGKEPMLNEMSLDSEYAYIVGKTMPTMPDFMKSAFIEFGKLSSDFTTEEWEGVRKFLSAFTGGLK